MSITAVNSLLVRHNSLRSLFIYQKQMLILTKNDQNPEMYETMVKETYIDKL